MPKYNHAVDIAFSVISEKEDGSDITPEMFRAALMRRVAELDANNEWAEVNTSKPFDTYEEE